MLGVARAFGAAAAGAVAVLVLVGCGASLDSGVPSPTPTQSPAAVLSPLPSPTPGASPSAAACVTPSSVAGYQLPGARTLAGNLQVKDLVPGGGAKVKVGDTIRVSYVGSLRDGTVFDSSAHDNQGKPISFHLAPGGGLIQGWVEGIPGMRVGGTRELVIPAALAYGCTSPSSSIPADSTLIFKVKLVGIG